ncbi:MAG: amino acid permease, partial [Nitrososphaerales archaeon]
MDSGALKREIGLVGAVAYGVGIIVGAGVYALIGKAAGQAGNSVWLSFILAAIVASFTGLSYAELSSIFPVSGAEYVYVEKAFKSDFWAFIIGWLVFLSGVISSSTVALGFGGYLMPYVGISETFAAIALIILLSLVNFWGIKESVRVNIILTLMEVSGLILVILFGVEFFGSVNYSEAPLGFRGIVSGAALIFFAFIGFESLAKMGEETKDPERTIPRALIIALIISTLLYVLVALSVVSIIPYGQLASSTSPLADVALKVQGPQAYLILSIIALFATSNTVLIILISTSRIAYGMARESSLP